MTSKKHRSIERIFQKASCGLGASVVAFTMLGPGAGISFAQTTATLSGTVQDTTGAIIPDAKVTLTNEDNGLKQVLQSNKDGLFTFASLVPGTYDVQADMKGFVPKEIKGIILHAGDERSLQSVALAVGAEGTSVTVEAVSNVITTDNGARTDVLDSKQIETLALEGRDTTELLKVLPGATTVSAGLTQNSSSYNDLTVSVAQSAVGSGININGGVNRGGTTILADGANIIDPGDQAGALATINPEMVSEVSVQTSAFGADTPFGPIVVSTISKSGGLKYHGEAYFDARNSVLDANDWSDNHAGIGQGAQSYYYPGGNFGGPVPGTHKKLFFWGGYERIQQNQGNQNVLRSYIPSPEMLAGDFTTDNADNIALCPQGFLPTTTSNNGQGSWCGDLSGTVFADGSTAAPSASLTPYGTPITNGSTTEQPNTGQKVPSQFIDPSAIALTKIWPKANANPATNGGYNYVQPIPNIDNGWLYRFRVDYQLGSNTKVYGTFQQGYNSDLAQGNGAHLYWTPGNAIPFPGGGETQALHSKALAGHFVHTFGSSATNDLLASWAYGSFPFVEPNPAAAYRTTLGYTAGKVFQTSSLNIPAYSSQGLDSFPDFSQASIFENPPGHYAVKKQSPQFNDVFTKVIGTHTVKAGAFEQNTDNYQSTFSTYQDGQLNGFGQSTNIITGRTLGSPNNVVANFEQGIVSSYSENNASPIQDVAYQIEAVFATDSWKASKHLQIEYGARFEHIGHWYDRSGTGLAVFYPDRVLADFNDGKYAPGYYWHQIDEGVPLSGQPSRNIYIDPRFGLSYDVFGNGQTLVRGGWGAYRFVTQVNDVDAPLVTAQQVLGYNLPGQKNVLLSQLSQLAYTACTAHCVNGSQTGLDPSDYGQPYTQSYNLTIDQKLKWNTLLDVAYVGSQTTQLSNNSEGIEGSNFAALADQNKTPLGAFFSPDPITGKTSTNPENLGKNPTNNTPYFVATGNQAADYHPYGYAYGTASVYMNQSTSYSNYNGLQVAFIKSQGKLGYNLNFTWSKTLGSSLQENPYVTSLNYGPTSYDRPYVFNASYYYNSGHTGFGNGLVNSVLSNWTVSGISTWQSGGYIPSALGNGVPNFGLGLSYNTTAAGTPFTTTVATPGGTPGQTETLATAQGVGNGFGAQTYYGTDAPVPILPVLTCNPSQGVGGYQLLNGKCFNAPSIGQQGGRAFPYLRANSYYDNDLAIYRTFHVPGREGQSIQLRASAFDWLNHPLSDFLNTNNLSLSYVADYNSKAITPNYNTNTPAPGFNYGSTVFGVLNNKTAAPYQRIVELNVKYNF